MSQLFFRPSGARSFPACFPRLAPWAVFFRRFAAGSRALSDGTREVLRRGIFFNRGIVPPRAASLRAISRSLRAFRAFRSDAVFFAIPLLWHWVMAPSSENSVGRDSSMRTASGPNRLGCPHFENREVWGSLVCDGGGNRSMVGQLPYGHGSDSDV
jgi:hypothetical protein